MKLSEVHEAITKSRPHDWKHIPLWASNTGTGFHHTLETRGNGEGQTLSIDRHTHQMVFRDDVSLTIGWGIKDSDDLVPDFLEKFSMVDKARSFFADVFWNNALIHREGVYAFKSLEHVFLPTGEPVYSDDDSDDAEVVRYEVTPFQVSLVRVLHSAELRNFDDHFARSEFVVVDAGE
ncbi:hypothetical protein ABZ234_03680 [Nocardiopsis sp. NPDC006198]|uniref:hypothetical protein n=1 Tax=Nocardiopsis sp. NPDC006198 TaxID=3154472 RepID=UPI0033B0CBC6